MDNNHLITGEPNELVAYVTTEEVNWGKWSDWQNGYGKLTVGAILLYVVYTVVDNGLPKIDANNSIGLLFTYGICLWLLSIAFSIYKGSIDRHKSLLVINSKGIFFNKEAFFWNELLSFQLSLEKGRDKGYHVYYLRLRTKTDLKRKINISVYNQKFDEIYDAVRQNAVDTEVEELDFTQII